MNAGIQKVRRPEVIHCFIRYLRHSIKCKACLASGGGKITDVDWQENE